MLDLVAPNWLAVSARLGRLAPAPVAEEIIPAVVIHSISTVADRNRPLDARLVVLLVMNVWGQGLVTRSRRGLPLAGTCVARSWPLCSAIAESHFRSNDLCTRTSTAAISSKLSVPQPSRAASWPPPTRRRPRCPTTR